MGVFRIGVLNGRRFGATARVSVRKIKKIKKKEKPARRSRDYENRSQG